MTHFGAFEDVEAQLRELREMLVTVAAWAGELDEEAFGERIRAHVRRHADPETAAEYEQAMPPKTLHPGLARALGRVASSSG